MYFHWNRDVFSAAFGTEMCWSWDVYDVYEAPSKYIIIV